MEPIPTLEIGWLNGWIPLALLVLVEDLLLKVFPKDLGARLFDRPGRDRKQTVFIIIGKVFSLACLVLVAFTPLRIGPVPSSPGR